jgi:hypothetical protein
MPSKPSLAARFSDALNPIVVKELRQAVQSRFVVTMLVVLLAIQLGAVGLYLIFSNPTNYDFTAGRTVFTILLGILLVVSLLFVPAYTAVRMIAERSDTDVDLLYITTIQPRSIIAGKLLAAAVLTGLIFSACLPFMTFTYFLRGIDLPTVFVVLCLSFLVVQACSLLALLMACLPFGRVAKVFLGLFVLTQIFSAFFATLGGAVSLIQFGVGSTLDSWEFWKPALIGLSIATLLWGLVFVLCVALISPPSANRALPIRRYLSLAGILTGCGVMMLSYGSKSHPPIIVWQIILSSVLALSFLAAVCERETPGPRVLRAVPPTGIPHLLAFLLYSGAASGLAWTCVASAFTLGLGWIWRNSHGGYAEVEDLQTTLAFNTGMLIYVYAYAVSGALVRRVWLTWLQPKWTWVLSVILMGLGTLLPVMVGFFFYYGEWASWEKKGLFIGNPFVFGNSELDKYYAGFALAFALIVTLLNLPWWRERWQAFRPPSAEGASS